MSDENGSVFPKTKCINRVGFEVLARTPVPKLPTPSHLEHIFNKQMGMLV